MSKVKLGVLVEQVLRKSGKFTSEMKEIIQSINDLDKEIDETLVQDVIDNLVPVSDILSHKSTIEALEKVKGSTKAEVLDGFDKGVLSRYAASLSPEQKAEYDKLKTIEKTKFLLNFWESQKDDKSAQRQIQKLQEEFERVQSEIEEKYVPKERVAQIEARASKLAQNAVNSAIVSSAKLSPQLIDTNGNRFFETNFISDFQASYLQSKGLSVDPETLELIDATGSKYMEKSKVVTVKEAVAKFIDNSEDWKKKSDPAPVGKTVIQPTNPEKPLHVGAKANMSFAQRLLDE